MVSVIVVTSFKKTHIITTLHDPPPIGLRPRTKVFVHFPIDITRLFDKIIGKIIRAYESTLKELSYATKLVTVAQFV